MRLAVEIQEEQGNSFPRLGSAVVADTCLLRGMTTYSTSAQVDLDCSGGRGRHSCILGCSVTYSASTPNWMPVAESLLILILPIPQDLEGKIIVDELKQEVISTSSKAEPPQCTSLAWSADGQTLFAGYTDNLVRVWQVTIGTR